MNVTVGVLPSPRLALGIDAASLNQSTAIGVRRSTFVTIGAQGYPFARFLTNAYLQAGVGVGMGSFPTRTITVDSSRLKTTRPALRIGAGFDVPVACPLWITAHGELLNTVGGKHDNSRIRPGYGTDNVVMLQFGATLNYYRTGPGRECNSRGRTRAGIGH